MGQAETEWKFVGVSRKRIHDFTPAPEILQNSILNFVTKKRIFFEEILHLFPTRVRQ